MPHGPASLERRFDAAFGAAANPLRHLGASAFLLLWLLVGTGVVLYAVLDTSAEGAYRSIETLSKDNASAGSVLRGVHRYAADALVLVIALHLLRELLLKRFAAYRAWSWTTGVVTLPLLFACAVGGFWLNWDRLAQYSAVTTAQWFDALPVLSSPFGRNFLAGAVSDRLFSLMVFVHLGLPLLLVFAVWAHIQRLGHPDVFPGRALAGGTLIVLVGLALAAPVHGQGAADLSSEAGSLRLDWFILFVHPLTESISPAGAWLLATFVMAALLALPLVAPRHAAGVARVEPAQCSGCGRCVGDCPFAAISLVPHPLRRNGVQLAQVKASACAGCGICVGACPSSTPFRGATHFVSGIELPGMPIDAVRAQVRDGLHAGSRRVVFGCDRGVPVRSQGDLLAVSLPCTAMLPPALVEYSLRHGAERVVVTGCREGSCAYRVGPQWMQARLDGTREPHLREVPAHAVRTVWADAGEEQRVREALQP